MIVGLGMRASVSLRENRSTSNTRNMVKVAMFCSRAIVDNDYTLTRLKGLS